MTTTNNNPKAGTVAELVAELGIEWAVWAKMSTADRFEAMSGRRIAWLDFPAGPERLAAFQSALRDAR